MRTDRRQGRPGYAPTIAKPGDDSPERRRREILDIKTRFDAILKFVTSRDGFVTSVPGAHIVTIEVQEDSDLPKELASRGFELREVDRRMRLIANAKSEDILGAGNKKTRVVSHAGFVPVIAYDFEL